MAKISTYPQPTPPQLSDYVIGTDISDLLMTKNFLLSDIITLATTTNQFVTIVGAQTITGSKTFDYGTSTGVLAPVIINVPAQTQPAFSPDALLIQINGQNPSTIPGYIGGVNVQAHLLDNILFNGDLLGDSGNSIGIKINSQDSHSGNFLEFRKRITSPSSDSPIFIVGNTQVLVGTDTFGTPTFGVTPKLVVADVTGGVMELRNLDTNIAPGSVLGRLQFSGKDDTSVAYATAAIEAVSQTFAGTGNGGGGILKFMTAPQQTGGSPTERMRIDQEGKVGVGTTVPTSKLHSVASLFGPISYDSRCAVFGYNTSTETVFNNPVGIAGRVLTSGGFAVYGDAQTGSGWGGYFDGKGYFKDNLGIGTTNFDATLLGGVIPDLAIADVAGATIQLSDNTATTLAGQILGAIEFASSNYGGKYLAGRIKATSFNGASGGASGGSDIIFETGIGATASIIDEKMRIAADGNVGIGETAPTSKLHVVGLPNYTNNTAALAGGLTVGAFYYTNVGGDGILKVVI